MQSEPHYFYIKGAQNLITGIPKVYLPNWKSSESQGKKEFTASVKGELDDSTEHVIEVEVNYAQRNCDKDYELM